jgi:SAM-dependent methyltransferase
VRAGFCAGARRIQRQFWDGQAAAWDAASAARGLQPHHLAAMAPWLNSPVVLVGAGRGTMLRALRAEGLEASGMDWSPAMVEAAEQDGVAGIALGDAAHLPYRDGSVATLLIATGTLLPTHTHERLGEYLGEARRVLKPAGHLILSLWYEHGSAAARRSAQSVRLPIHTLRAHVHWDLTPLSGLLRDMGFVSLAQLQQADLLIWSLARPE